VIRSIEIRNQRGIREGKLEDLSSLVVLVGPNSSGKSTVLDALHIGASSKPATATGMAVKRRFGVRRGARWLLWRADENISAEIVVKSDDRERTIRIDVPPSEPEQAVVVRVSFSDVSSLDKQEGQRHVHVDVLNNYGQTGEPELTGFPDVQLVDCRDNSQPLYRTYSRAVEQGRREEAHALVRSLIPGVEEIEILAEGDTPTLYLNYSDHSVPVTLAGDGIQSLLRVALDIAIRPGSIVLLEEPDLFQHPGAICHTARAIWEAVRNNTQVIITTHSLDLIDALLSEAKTEEEISVVSVYRLLLQDGTLRSSRMAGDDILFSRVEIGNDLR